MSKQRVGTLTDCAGKCTVMLITVGIGLWCGWHDSYSSFYIAALVQAVNNAYESFPFLSGYNKSITGFYLLSILGSVVSFIISIIHFTPDGTCVDNIRFVIGITMLLCIPIVHLGIEIYDMWRKGQF